MVLGWYEMGWNGGFLDFGFWMLGSAVANDVICSLLRLFTR
jgi:hypothetical protein